MTDAPANSKKLAIPECCSGLATMLSPELFKALCDPNRIAILVRLAECCRPCSVTEIAACCPVNISVVSRHLTMLRDAGILVAEKRGRHVYYSVATHRLVQSLRAIADALEACCPVPDDTAEKKRSTT